MFVDLLLLMEWRCKLGNRCKFIGVIETTLAPFKVLDPNVIYEQGVPEDLTKPIVTSPYVYIRKTRLYTQDLPKNSVPVTQKIEYHVNYFTDSCDKCDKTPDGLRRE